MSNKDYYTDPLWQDFLRNNPVPDLALAGLYRKLSLPDCEILNQVIYCALLYGQLTGVKQRA